MNVNWILSNLEEAQEQLGKTIEQLKTKQQDYGVGQFIVEIEEVYHHLNIAWNSRDASEEQARKCSDEDFYAWRQFPVEDFYFGPYKLLPNQSLKLTAEAEVVSRCAQEDELVVAARRQCGTVFRVVRKESYQRRSLAPVR